MEITSFILGVCAVILILMVAGTSVNYMAIKILRKDIDNLDRDICKQLEQVDEARGKQHFEHIDYVDKLHNKHEDDLNELYRYIDSRIDKLDNKFMDEVRLLLQETQALGREISRVEKGYKEKINY